MYTGLFYRAQIADYYKAQGLPEPYKRTALPDYNGHHGIRELCDICPLSQLKLCANSHRVPSPDRILELASDLPEAVGLRVVEITDRAAVVSGLETEQPRYYLQHALGFQVHDVRYPHVVRRHGRADIGWKDAKHDG